MLFKDIWFLYICQTFCCQTLSNIFILHHIPCDTVNIDKVLNAKSTKKKFLLIGGKLCFGSTNKIKNKNHWFTRVFYFQKYVRPVHKLETISSTGCNIQKIENNTNFVHFFLIYHNLNQLFLLSLIK